MSFPRADVEELKLTNSPNLSRALKREAAESEPLSSDAESEIAKLDELIGLAMKACKRGSTFKGKRNPAFANLASLIKSRDLLLCGKRPKKSSKSMLDEFDKMLAAPVEN